MSVLLKLKYLLPGRRRAIEQDMREELESLAALSDADGARADLGSLTFVAEEGRAGNAARLLRRDLDDEVMLQRVQKVNQILLLLCGKSDAEALVIEVQNITERIGRSVVKVGRAAGQPSKDRPLQSSYVLP